MRPSKERAITYERAWPNEKNEGKAGKKRRGTLEESQGDGVGKKHLGEEGGRQQELNKHASTRTATHTHTHVCMHVCVCVWCVFLFLPPLIFYAAVFALFACCPILLSFFCACVSSSVIHVTTGVEVGREVGGRNEKKTDAEHVKQTH